VEFKRTKIDSKSSAGKDSRLFKFAPGNGSQVDQSGGMRCRQRVGKTNAALPLGFEGGAKPGVLSNAFGDP
jgi:hypothetical protein